MNRRSLLITLAITLLVGSLGGLNEVTTTTWKELWARFNTGGEDANSVNHFKTSLLDQANLSRISARQPLLAEDLELENWLQKEFAAGMQLDDLDLVASYIHDSWPRYLNVQVSAGSGPSLKVISDNLIPQIKPTDPEQTHLTSALRPVVGGIATQALVVTGRRLQGFSPEILHHTTDSDFLSVCTTCNVTHTVRLQRKDATIKLNCPKCRKTYAVVAADSQGYYHHVTQFLTGYQPPAIYPKDQSRLHQLAAIWTSALKTCTAGNAQATELEQTGHWQTAVETQTNGRGGSGDMAVLLADWLLARGYETRVAIGSCRDIAHHAWCVVRVGSIEYLLDNMGQGNAREEFPPLVSRVGSMYKPDILFDRSNLYVHKGSVLKWNGNYWSAFNWTQVNPHKRQPKAMAFGGSPGVQGTAPFWTSPSPSIEQALSPRSWPVFKPGTRLTEFALLSDPRRNWPEVELTF